MEARWAATVVAKRILERTRDLRVRSAASSLSPEGPPYAVQRRVVACWDAARMAGLKLPVRANR
jgi:hypothetical protein